MNHRLTPGVAFALLCGALLAPAAQASIPFSPTDGHHHHAKAHHRSARLAATTAAPVVSAFSGLGIEGGALTAQWAATQNAQLTTAENATR
jgi:hypothetical protein